MIQTRQTQVRTNSENIIINRDIGFSAPSAVSDTDVKLKSPTIEEKPKKKTRTESIIEEAKKTEPERKEKKNDWDMFAEADNFKGSVDVSLNNRFWGI